MDTITVTKTVVCPLETSQRKNERVSQAIEDWQRVAGRVAQLMPSVGPNHWRAQDTTLAHLVRNQCEETSLRTHDEYQAAYKVGEAFGSWHSNNHEKARPTFGDGDYARFCHCGVELSENERGWGIKVGLEPYKPEWWHIKTRPYHEEIFEGGVDTGSAELHLSNSGALTCHLTVKEDVGVIEPENAETVVGVDLGERVLYAAVAYSDGIEDVQIESGREFRHHRTRLKRKRTQLMENDDLRGVKACRDEHRRYTDHVTHKASREIVNIAIENQPACIAIEDLGGYRESASEPIHDWPYAELQTKIAYKAREAGIPVVSIDPSGTSQTCSKCGTQDPRNRHGDDFHCVDCGYQVHADVNAATNIATT